jgi:ADP-ribosyl-[dinitrogen reductase] hydrolase
MALCLAYSLLEQHGFDADDQMQRYNNWREQGYMSSNGRCFDIGVTVSEALSQYLESGNPFAGPCNPFAAGNGSLMRLAPVAMYFSPNMEQVILFAGESSRTTHGAKECIDACRYFATLLHCALQGMDKESLLGCSLYQPTTRKIKAIQQQNYREKSVSQIRGSGYVVDCLEAALWCFSQTDNFADAVLSAANLGDDADTTAAVCGQIAGAFYGVQAIPEQWRKIITLADDIISLADRLHDKTVL